MAFVLLLFFLFFFFLLDLVPEMFDALRIELTDLCFRIFAV